MKTPVIPPDTDLPKAVSGFEAFIRGDELTLRWDAPDEKKRAEIMGYKVFFEDAEEMTRCGCRKYRELAFLDLGASDTDWIRDGKVDLQIPVRPELFGKTYHYAAVPVSRKGFAGLESPEITVRWTPPPPAPRELKAEPGDRSVLLQWAAAEGPVPPGFNIYRRAEEEERFPFHPVNAVPVAELRYLDKSVRNGVEYHYLVRAAASTTQPWIESRASEETAVTPVDRIAPAPPSGVEAIPGKEIVRLLWEENKEADLAGYHIYRRSGSRGGFIRIGSARPPAVIFTDTNLRAGVVEEYYVTAYDSAPAANESAPSRIVKARP